MSSSVLVTDFDGTITRRDFYSCVVEKLLAPEDLEPWNLYAAGEITHLEALRRIFARIRADEEALARVMEAMTIDPELGPEIERLEDAGWEVGPWTGSASTGWPVTSAMVSARLTTGLQMSVFVMGCPSE